MDLRGTRYRCTDGEGRIGDRKREHCDCREIMVSTVLEAQIREKFSHRFKIV